MQAKLVVGHSEKEPVGSEKALGCPCFRPVEIKTAYPIQGYCVRLRDYGLRLPTVAELRLFCKTAEYGDCSIYSTDRTDLQIKNLL